MILTLFALKSPLKEPSLPGFYQSATPSRDLSGPGVHSAHARGTCSGACQCVRLWCLSGSSEADVGLSEVISMKVVCKSTFVILKGCFPCLSLWREAP